jgi:membrane dipeptidase
MSGVFVNAWSFAPAEQVIQFLSRLRADVAHHEGFFIAETAADLGRTTGGGGADGIGLYLSLESATAFADQPQAFEELYGLGLRMAGLCYNDGNSFGDGLGAGDGDGGLTLAGQDLVHMFNDLGIVLDLGHVGDQTALDAVAASKVPVVVSHAGARAIWDTPRMKDDRLLHALAGSGGVIGISAAPNTTRSKNNPNHSIDSFMDHLFYCVEQMGIDHVALGPDTMFGDHAGIHRLGRGDGQWGQHSGREQGGLVGFVDGVENPSENFVNVAVYLRRRNWSDDEVKKILGGNARRVLQEVFVR